MSFVSLETTVTIHPKSPAIASQLGALHFTAFYTHFQEHGGIPTITLVIQPQSFYSLCDVASKEYGYRSALCVDSYKGNLNASNRLDTTLRIGHYEDSDEGLYLCKFSPVDYMAQYDTADKGAAMLSTMLAAANARGFTTGMRRRSFASNLDTSSVQKLAHCVAAAALANAVVYYSSHIKDYRDYLNALEGPYMSYEQEGLDEQSGARQSSIDLLYFPRVF